MQSPSLLVTIFYYSIPAGMLGRGLNKYQRHPGDGVQRSLRVRFPPRLMPGVDMTSDVKGWEQLFYVCLMFFPLV
jgi:hypothetical protein